MLCRVIKPIFVEQRVENQQYVARVSLECVVGTWFWWAWLGGLVVWFAGACFGREGSTGNSVGGSGSLNFGRSTAQQTVEHQAIILISVYR